MSANVSTSDLKKLETKFSIKNFISDLPRMLNEAFSVIYKCITSFYDPDKDTLKSSSAEIDYITASTIVCQNITIKNSDSSIIDPAIAIEIKALKEKIDDLYEKIEEVKTKYQ